MRTQYHLRPSEQGLLAWDVGRLIGLAAGLAPAPCPLADIRELSEPYWYPLGGDSPTCASIAEHLRLVQAADLAWPILLCPAGRVMDGMHRVVKAHLLGLATVPAYHLPTLPAPDYVGVDPADLPYDND